MSRVLAKRGLIPHPDAVAPKIHVGSKVSLIGTGVLKLEYVVIGALDLVSIPSIEMPERTDNLWEHTCFEAFVGTDWSECYYEFNFAPSRRWASYRFDKYRDGMMEAINLPQPDIHVECDGSMRFALTAYLDLTLLGDPALWNLGLSSVIETSDGSKSYWALKHPVGAPDFHHRDCFALKLAPPEVL